MTTATRLDTGAALSSLREIDWERHLRDPSGDTSSLSLLSGLGLGMLVGIVVAIMWWFTDTKHSSSALNQIRSCIRQRFIAHTIFLFPT